MAEAPDVNRLSSAAANGNCEEIEQILQSNIDINSKNNFGRTPLQVVKLGCPSAAELLLMAGADPTLRDPVLGLTVTHDAAREGYVDMLQVLVQNNADVVNLVDDDGNLPLHLAAREGQLGAVEFLASRTLQPFTVNARGLTPFDLASDRRHPDVQTFLRQLQAQDGRR